jgi:hypothetical protein
MKKCSIFFGHKGNQFKITLKFHLTPVRMAILFVFVTQTTTNAGKDVGKKEYFYTTGGNVN